MLESETLGRGCPSAFLYIKFYDKSLKTVWETKGLAATLTNVLHIYIKGDVASIYRIRCPRYPIPIIKFSLSSQFGRFFVYFFLEHLFMINKQFKILFNPILLHILFINVIIFPLLFHETSKLQLFAVFYL